MDLVQLRSDCFSIYGMGVDQGDVMSCSPGLHVLVSSFCLAIGLGMIPRGETTSGIQGVKATAKQYGTQIS